MEDMPDEVIINIFSYLPLRDRKTTRLVSKRWLQLSYSRTLIKNDVTVVNNYAFLDETTSPYTRHINIRIKIVEVEGNSSNMRSPKFLSKYGHDIKSVEISQVRSDGNKILLDIFKNCPNLLHLSLSYWDDRDMGLVGKPSKVCCKPCIYQLIINNLINFPNLLSLDLKSMWHLKFEAFRLLTLNAPLLRRIGLERWEPQSETELRAIIGLFREIVTRHANQLKVINFCYSDITDEDVKEIAEVTGPQLTGFYIEGCRRLTDSCLPYIANQMTNLEKLNVAGCSFSNDSFITLFSGMTKLTHVSLEGCSQISDMTVAALKSLTNLTLLGLTGCYNISDNGIKQVFGNEIRAKMKYLKLSRTAITDDAIISIAPNLPNLRYLYLDDCTQLSDKSLEAIFSHNRLLRYLSLMSCHRLCNLSIGPSINALKGLIFLDLWGCFKISGKSVSCIRLIELQTAYLGSEQLSRHDVTSVLSGCPSLQSLYLSPLVRPKPTWSRPIIICVNFPHRPSLYGDLQFD